ncbi:uncharacterized protein LOC127747747 [Arachis duranensis]|uniref:Uncharacterized protein LOC127747747 n=1 Tax=Arachis duranensis TaxID=130453 RepID=A0A9C6TZV0_ARADU|nr:uncharacterized protein LOC127747747 [Arachis duranensis]
MGERNRCRQGGAQFVERVGRYHRKDDQVDAQQLQLQLEELHATPTDQKLAREKQPSRRGAQKMEGLRRTDHVGPVQSNMRKRISQLAQMMTRRMSLLPRGCANCITKGLTNKNQVLIHPKGTSIRIMLSKQHLSLACPMQEHSPLCWCNMKNGSSMVIPISFRT